MESVEDWKATFPCSVDQAQDLLDGVCGLQVFGKAIVQLSICVHKIIVWVDQENRGIPEWFHETEINMRDESSNGT